MSFNEEAIQMIGWVPAIIFPLAALMQLYKIYIVRCADGVSAMAWFAFGIANLSLYIYAEKYEEMQTLVGMVGQALIDFMIAGLTVYFARLNSLVIEEKDR
jgi:uncharacterized protein with PQ loop repeat